MADTEVRLVLVTDEAILKSLEQKKPCLFLTDGKEFGYVVTRDDAEKLAVDFMNGVSKLDELSGRSKLILPGGY